MGEELIELQKQKEDIKILLSTLEEAYGDASITKEHYDEVKGKNQKKLEELNKKIISLEKVGEDKKPTPKGTSEPEEPKAEKPSGPSTEDKEDTQKGASKKPKAKPGRPRKGKAKPSPKQEPPTEPTPLNFLGDQKLDEILDDPEKFNAVLVDVHTKGVEEGAKIATENVLKNIPQLVTTYVSRHSTMSNLVSDFYKSNPDLVGVKKTVAAVANEVAAENPEMSIEEVMVKLVREQGKYLE